MNPLDTDWVLNFFISLTLQQMQDVVSRNQVGRKIYVQINLIRLVIKRADGLYVL